MASQDASADSAKTQGGDAVIDEKEFDHSIELIDLCGRYVQLAMKLPSAPDRPRFLCCEKCGTLLGPVWNSCGVAVGHFERRDNEWSQLVGAALSTDRISMRCASCGRAWTWRPTKH